MSWGTNGTVENGEAEYAMVSGMEVKEHEEQFHVAEKVLFDMIESGALGDPNGQYKFTMSGHGNPNHEKTPGWSNDCLTIGVYQV